jgi:membrane associated rhomboid family serine protease
MSTSETRYCYRHPDRPTGLSCSECGRPICTDCMTPAAVGIRCPDHAGGRSRSAGGGGRQVRARRGVARAERRVGATPGLVTKVLIGLNVAVYLVTAVQGAGLNAPGGSLFAKWVLFGPAVAQGDWWRLVTAMFLHASVLHIAFNMFALWMIGTPVEEYLGRARFLGLYLVSGLAGSAGSLIQTPGLTVGASGAIFGILGAMLIIEYQLTGSLAGNAMTWIVINLVLSFTISSISVGGHIGGLIGGILVTLAYARYRRGHASYGGLGPVGVLGLVAVAVASVAIAYWQVRGYA